MKALDAYFGDDLADDDGNSAAEQGVKLRLNGRPDDPELDFIGEFKGFSTNIREDKGEATDGEEYYLFHIEVVDAKGTQLLEGKEYTAYFDGDTKTRKPAAQRQETKNMLRLIAEVAGKSLEWMHHTDEGQQFVLDFAESGGADWAGTEYNFYHEVQKGGWKKMRAKSA